MGTSSRIVIKRKRSNDVFLWQRWDGYLEGVGADLCKQLQQLLEKYSISELQDMVENIQEGTEIFETDKIIDMFTNLINVKFEECDQVLYEYVIDLENKFLTAVFDYTKITLPFGFIKQGITFHDLYERM